jgi:hypothetical protein
MRAMGLLLLAGILGGCTTVKLTQRDGCWVRSTHRTLHGTQEDVGPCVRPPPRWSEDRLTRLVQECVAQADYRWQGRALAAWNRHEPLPAQDSQATVIKTCMNEAAAGVVTQNETLRQRLAEISSDREALRADATKGTEHLRASADKLTEYLGEAAKRPPPVATATATSTSDGTATTDTGLQSDSSASGLLPAGAVAAPPPFLPAAAAPASPAASADPAGPATEARPAPPATPSAAKRAHAAKARRSALTRALRRAECDGPAAALESAAGATGADGTACPRPAATAPGAGGSR